MTNLAAVLVLDQLETVEDKIATFNRHYNILQMRLGMFCTIGNSGESINKYGSVQKLCNNKNPFGVSEFVLQSNKLV